MQEQILSILRRHGLMTLATNRPDGWPQATSVSYVHRGLSIYFMISRTSQKFANLTADDRVSISIASSASTPVHFEGLSMSARAAEPSDEPYRSDILWQMRARHPGYFDTSASDMTRSAIFRASPEIITIVDFSKGLGHSDVVTVNADQSLELSPARLDDWGPDPAPKRYTAHELGAALRAEG
jgi:nitroimidazol reductase NimA-like FMN-containing flavoprotein (pyridoxamine 5'-phosphate oxidase superfamily)